jgi:hypothetical protein
LLLWGGPDNDCAIISSAVQLLSCRQQNGAQQANVCSRTVPQYIPQLKLSDLQVWVPSAAIDCLHVASQHFQRLAVLCPKHLQHAAGGMEKYVAVIRHGKLPCLRKQPTHQRSEGNAAEVSNWQ